MMNNVTFETPAGDIAGIIHGDKANPLIIALHGYGEGASCKNWDYMYEPLANMGFLVVGIDFPGFGKSPGKRHKSRSEYMRIPGGPVDIVEHIIALMDKPSAHLLGYDWGAGIAISAAIKLNNESRQTRIDGLILFHITYTQQQPQEIAHYIDRKRVKTLLLWVNTEQNHPIKALKNEWKPAFEGASCDEFDLRPYSAKNTKGCYRVLAKQIIPVITQWLQSTSSTSVVEESDEKKVYDFQHVSNHKTIV